MKRLLPILALCSLLSCELASLLRIGECSVMRCMAGTESTCSPAQSSCSASACDVAPACNFMDETGDCGKTEKKECPYKPCVPCSPNCCVFLVPDYGFTLSLPPTEAVTEKPQGKQDQYPQSFHPSIWHPPAPLV